MLLFDEDLQKRQSITARFLLAQAALGLGSVDEAERLLCEVLDADPNHALAAEFLRRTTHPVTTAESEDTVNIR